MGFFSPSTPPPPPPPPPIPDIDDAERQRAKDEAEKAARRRKGLSNTVLTGGLGIVGPANTKKPTLLGQIGGQNGKSSTASSSFSGGS